MKYGEDKGWIWHRKMIAMVYPDGYKRNDRLGFLSTDLSARWPELEALMPTFRGVPPSAAESFRGQVFARS